MLRDLLEALLVHLPGWTVKPGDDWDAGSCCLTDGKMEVHAHQLTYPPRDQGKLHFTPVALRCPDGWTYQWQVKGIRLSASRAAQLLARDLNRRLLASMAREWPKLQAQRAGHESDAAWEEKVASSLAGILGGTVRRDSRTSPCEFRRYPSDGGCQVVGYLRGKVAAYKRRVDLELTDLRPEVARHVLELLAAYGPEEGAEAVANG